MLNLNHGRLKKVSNSEIRIYNYPQKEAEKTMGSGFGKGQSNGENDRHGKVSCNKSVADTKRNQ